MPFTQIGKLGPGTLLGGGLEPEEEVVEHTHVFTEFETLTIGTLTAGFINAGGLEVTDAGPITTTGVISGNKFLGSLGSATAPTFSFTSDQNTGIYRPAVDQLGATAGGVEQWRTGNASVPGLNIAGGSLSIPGIRFLSDGDTGFHWVSSGTFGLATNGVQAAEVAPGSSSVPAMAIGRNDVDVDGMRLLQLRSVRAWTFRQRSTGATARLALQSDVSGKTFDIEDSDNVAVFRVQTTGAIGANDKATGLVEIFPKGTLIAMDTVTDFTDITNVSSVEAVLSATVQTIACEYANQEIYVDVTVMVVWGSVGDATLFIRPAVAGTARGMGSTTNFAPTSAAGTGNTGSTDPGDTNSAGTHGHLDNGHIHSDPQGGSTGTGFADITQSGSHTHTMGTHVHSGPSHTHDAFPSNIFQTMRWIGAVTANGSGNIEIAISGAGDGVADILQWQIAYQVWRR